MLQYFSTESGSLRRCVSSWAARTPLGRVGASPGAAIGLVIFKERLIPDISFWFESSLYEYSDYPLHPSLNDLLPPTTTVFSTNGNSVTTGFHFPGFSLDELHPIFEYYAKLLKDNEWFTLNGELKDTAFIFAKLDEQRTIYIKTMLLFEGYELSMGFTHSIE